MAAEVEEAVLHADHVDAEELLEPADERLLDLVPRLDVLAVEVRPRELEAVFAASGRAADGHRRLLNEARQIEAAHEDLRLRRSGQHAAERVLALGHGDAVLEVALELQLARRQLPVGVAPLLELHVSGGRAALHREVDVALHAPQREAVHLEHDAAVWRHQVTSKNAKSASARFSCAFRTQLTTSAGRSS